MASIRKVQLQDESTRWRIRVYIGPDPETGRRRYITRTFDKKTDADREATRLERQKDLGALTAPAREPFAGYLTQWLDNVKTGTVRARTLEGYRQYVRRYVQRPPGVLPPIGSIRVDRLTPAAFQNLYGAMTGDMNLSPRTVRYLHAILRQCLGHAVATGELGRNPTDHVKLPKAQSTTEKAHRAMSKDEAARFLKAARSDRYYPLWVLLLTGGLRPGEAFGLKWGDMDVAAGRVHVRRALTRRGLPDTCECGHGRDQHGDGGRAACEAPECGTCERFQRAERWRLVEPKTSRARRVVALPDVAVRALKEWKARQAEERLKAGAEYEDDGGEPFVFTTPFGQPLTHANLRRWHYVPIMAEAELGEWEGEEDDRTFRPAYRVYDLRHTCATLLLLAGENPKVVSERLGHASITLTLDTYSHVLPDMQEASAEKLEAMFGTR